MLAWVSFTLMTQCAPAGIFTLAGAYQMIVWALGKHRNYRTEFKVRAAPGAPCQEPYHSLSLFQDYPMRRKAVIPFIL